MKLTLHAVVVGCTTRSPMWCTTVSAWEGPMPMTTWVGDRDVATHQIHSRILRTQGWLKKTVTQTKEWKKWWVNSLSLLLCLHLGWCSTTNQGCWQRTTWSALRGWRRWTTECCWWAMARCSPVIESGASARNIGLSGIHGVPTGVRKVSLDCAWTKPVLRKCHLVPA